MSISSPPGWSDPRWVLPLAALAGLISPLAYAPFGWFWVALLSPAVLFALVARAPRRLALQAAYLHGVCYYAAGGHWIWFSVGEFGGGPLVATVFCVVLALLFGLITWLLVRIWFALRPAGEAPSLMVTLPAAWLLLEWVQGWIFTGTTWLQLGYSQTDSWLGGYAPLLGSLGISLLLAVMAGALAWAVLTPSARGRGLVAVAVVAVFGTGWALDRPWTQPSGEPIRVALLQGNVSQDEKWEPAVRERTLALYQRLTERHWDVDLVIWPETAVPAYLHQVQDDYLLPLAEEAEFRGTDLLIGLPVLDREQPRGRVFNSVLALGSTVDFYHKQHLVPFGEYVPFRQQLGGLLDVFGAPMSDFTPGWRANTLNVAGHAVGVFICYEITFPGQVRRVLPAAEVLVNVSNDGWFGNSVGPHQHFQMARMRAMETGRPLLRSTNTGITAAVDERGRVVARAPQFTVDALVAEVTPHQGMTPYARAGDWPVIGAFTLMLLLSAGLRWLAPRLKTDPLETDQSA